MRKIWLEPKYVFLFFLALFVNNLYSQDYKEQISNYLTQIESLNSSTNKVEIAGFESKIAYLYWEVDELENTINHFEIALQLNL